MQERSVGTVGRRALLLVALGLAAACDGTPPPDGAAARPADGGDRADAAERSAEREAFWSRLHALCGRAFRGRVTEGTAAGDTALMEETLVMHVRDCRDDEVRVPFHVGTGAGADRSRTWVFTRTEAGLHLEHDHRHEDGSEDEITGYGGDTDGPGTAARQEFRADAYTAGLIPEAATNVWSVEIEPGERFVYALRREGTDRRFRAEFDLSEEVPPPPPPWGAT